MYVQITLPHSSYNVVEERIIKWLRENDSIFFVFTSDKALNFLLVVVSYDFEVDYVQEM